MSRIEERTSVIADVLMEERGDRDASEDEAPRPSANDYGRDLLRQRLLAGVWRA
jgi:hypothetical protein